MQNISQSDSRDLEISEQESETKTAGGGAVCTSAHQVKKPGDPQVCRLCETMRRIFRQWGLRNPIASDPDNVTHSPTQIHTVMWLGNDGPLTMGELAHRTGITEKTITGVVDRLERDGLLKRERCSSDRRIVRARLTKKGNAAFERFQEITHRKLGLFLNLLDNDDRDALFRILEKVATKLGGHGETP